MIEDMPPGFRFYPTEPELISFYLHHKLEGSREDLNRLMDRVIPVVNIYDFNPWELPQFSEYLCHKDPEQWFFFIPRQESEARGGRPNRLTTEGYWKATGSPGFVYSSNRAIGEKRTMVFYKGRAPTGRKTEWKMNEYKAIEAAEASTSSSATPVVRQELSLCRVYKNSKCLRAFDRRPLPLPPPTRVLTGEPGAPLHQPAVINEAITISHYQNPQIPEAKSSSESSSSGDHHGQPSLNGESSSTQLCSDSELWWDWDAVGEMEF